MTAVVKRGSVKDILEHPDPENYIFQFSDRYSVFDWGEMPDDLPRKGASLAHMADFFFRTLGERAAWEALEPDDESLRGLLSEFRRNGAPHHGVSLLAEGSDRYVVRKVDVLPLPLVKGGDGRESYDYSAYETRPTGCLVPLEIIFRFGVPKGSSLFERLGDESYCRELGLEAPPREGEMLARPVIEFSTKLEASDRYVTRRDILGWSVLGPEEFDNLRAFALLIAFQLRKIFLDADVTLWDGKIETAFAPPAAEGGPRGFFLVDSVGPDELRLTHGGVQLSKETIRRFYRDSAWHKAVVQSKKLAEERGVADWKRICMSELNAEPEALPAGLAREFGSMYCALSNALARSRKLPEPFPGEPELALVVSKLKERAV